MKETLQDGALALLGETTDILNDNGIEYIIVGGWSPYLLNKGGFPHPGTKDVDVLFKAGAKKGELKTLIDIFLKNGFIQSAKHPFQLLKIIRINGYDFMFNVDLLHPNDQEKEPEMFVDHINFPVKESQTIQIDYSGKTIILPRSDFFFNDFSTNFVHDFELTNGKRKKIEFNLLNEAGLILSKAESVFNVKRTRDAYDILLAIHQSRDYNSTISQLSNIMREQEQIQLALQKMHTPKKLLKLEENTYEWLSKLEVSESEKNTAPIFQKFFGNLKIPLSSD